MQIGLHIAGMRWPGLFILIASLLAPAEALLTPQIVGRQRLLQGGRVPALLSSKTEVVTPSVIESGETAPPRLAYATLWVGLLVYAFGFAPGGSEAAGALDAELIKLMIQTPYDATNTISPVFGAIFNALGILPAIYASLLLPGGKLSQKLPALPFVVSSFALGFFGVGPYLGLRNKRTEVSDSERGRGSALFEFKLTSLAMLGFALFLTYFAVTGQYAGSDRVADFIQAFQTQRLVHVSTIDFTILSLAVQDPMREDMQRRNWSGPDAWAFAAVPVIGPCLYLLTRPSLPKE